jgi:hypothetical protein
LESKESIPCFLHFCDKRLDQLHEDFQNLSSEEKETFDLLRDLPENPSREYQEIHNTASHIANKLSVKHQVFDQILKKLEKENWFDQFRRIDV